MNSEAPPKDLDELRERVLRGWRPEYLFFWGHALNPNGGVGSECLSQWFPAPFRLAELHFATAEHYMMWSKAKLFGDDAAASAVLAARSPAAAKRIGRGVSNFVESVWLEHRFDIVVRASVAKFAQHEALRGYLLGTNARVLVEASPVDRIWGIGLGAKHEHAQNPRTWRGLNLLGFALMTARERLARGDQ